MLNITNLSLSVSLSITITAQADYSNVYTEIAIQCQFRENPAQLGGSVACATVRILFT